MLAKQWKELIYKAISKDASGNSETLDLICANLELNDTAKQALREKGYGWIGLDILETVRQEVPNLT